MEFKCLSDESNLDAHRIIVWSDYPEGPKVSYKLDTIRREFITNSLISQGCYQIRKFK